MKIEFEYLGVTLLASSSRDRFVHVFDTSKDYQLVATLDDHSAAITAVRFTFSSITSNLQLISCSADKSLIFRSISKVHTFDQQNLLLSEISFVRMKMANINSFVRIILLRNKHSTIWQLITLVNLSILPVKIE